MSMNKQYKNIWTDLDGVLVGLVETLSYFDGYNCPLIWMNTHIIDWNSSDPQESMKNNFRDSIFRNVPKEVFVDAKKAHDMGELMLLYNILKTEGYKIKILSSCMDNELSDMIKDQKMKWIYKYLLKDYGIDFFDEIVICRGSSEKIKYLGENDLLIDDYEKTYNKNPEQIILHRNFDDTVQALTVKLGIDVEQLAHDMYYVR